MKKVISIVMDSNYFVLFPPLFNSIKCFQKDAVVKVYNYKNFNHLLKNILISSGIQIVDTYMEVSKYNNPLIKNRAKPISLDQGKDEIELYMDIDAILLSNMDDIFLEIENGFFIGVTEWDHILTAKDNSCFKGLNSGFVGFNRSKHSDLIKEWSELSKYDSDDDLSNIPSNYKTEQFILSYFLNKMSIKHKLLNTNLFMNTFEKHAKPKKMLSFENDQPILLNADTQEKIRYYHFTGGIGVNNNKLSGRFWHANRTSLYEQLCETNKEIDRLQKEWYDLWQKKYNSPVAILCDYFNKIGPLKCPEIFKTEFKKRVSILLTELLQNDYSYISKEVLAISIAYDYIVSLNYRLIGNSWLETPLKMLIKKDIYKGDKTIGWDNKKADISLDFKTNSKPNVDWIWKGTELNQNIERLNGLNININKE